MITSTFRLLFKQPIFHKLLHVRPGTVGLLKQVVFFYRPDALPVAQPTAMKALKASALTLPSFSRQHDRNTLVLTTVFSHTRIRLLTYKDNEDICMVYLDCECADGVSDVLFV